MQILSCLDTIPGNSRQEKFSSKSVHTFGSNVLIFSTHATRITIIQCYHESTCIVTLDKVHRCSVTNTAHQLPRWYCLVCCLFSFSGLPVYVKREESCRWWCSDSCALPFHDASYTVSNLLPIIAPLDNIQYQLCHLVSARSMLFCIGHTVQRQCMLWIASSSTEHTWHKGELTSPIFKMVIKIQ